MATNIANRSEWLKLHAEWATYTDLEDYPERLVYALIANDYLWQNDDITIDVHIEPAGVAFDKYYAAAVYGLTVTGAPHMAFAEVASELSNVLTEVGVNLMCHSFQMHFAYPPKADGVIIQYERNG